MKPNARKFLLKFVVFKLSVKSSGEHRKETPVLQTVGWQRGRKRSGNTKKVFQRGGQSTWDEEFQVATTLFLTSDFARFKKKDIIFQVFESDEIKQQTRSLGKVTQNVGELASIIGDTTSVEMCYTITSSQGEKGELHILFQCIPLSAEDPSGADSGSDSARSSNSSPVSWTTASTSKEPTSSLFYTGRASPLTDSPSFSPSSAPTAPTAAGAATSSKGLGKPPKPNPLLADSKPPVPLSPPSKKSKAGGQVASPLSSASTDLYLNPVRTAPPVAVPASPSATAQHPLSTPSPPEPLSSQSSQEPAPKKAKKAKSATRKVDKMEQVLHALQERQNHAPSSLPSPTAHSIAPAVVTPSTPQHHPSPSSHEIAQPSPVVKKAKKTKKSTKAAVVEPSAPTTASVDSAPMEISATEDSGATQTKAELPLPQPPQSAPNPDGAEPENDLLLQLCESPLDTDDLAGLQPVFESFEAIPTELLQSSACAVVSLASRGKFSLMRFILKSFGDMKF